MKLKLKPLTPPPIEEWELPQGYAVVQELNAEDGPVILAFFTAPVPGAMATALEEAEDYAKGRTSAQIMRYEP